MPPRETPTPSRDGARWPSRWTRLVTVLMVGTTGTTPSFGGGKACSAGAKHGAEQVAHDAVGRGVCQFDADDVQCAGNGCEDLARSPEAGLGVGALRNDAVLDQDPREPRHRRLGQSQLRTKVATRGAGRVASRCWVTARACGVRCERRGWRGRRDVAAPWGMATLYGTNPCVAPGQVYFQPD